MQYLLDTDHLKRWSVQNGSRNRSHLEISVQSLMRNNIQQEDENVQTFLDVTLDKTTFSVMPSFESSESDDTRYRTIHAIGGHKRLLNGFVILNAYAELTMELKLPPDFKEFLKLLNAHHVDYLLTRTLNS